jgi:sterol desaturase/sphingolipid hydroxylase (fatty acid hydroxylase superfamily)
MPLQFSHSKLFSWLFWVLTFCLLEPLNLASADSGGSCDFDIKTFCSQIQPGDGRITNCLTSHFDNLSISCKRVSVESQLARGWLTHPSIHWQHLSFFLIQILGLFFIFYFLEKYRPAALYSNRRTGRALDVAYGFFSLFIIRPLGAWLLIETIFWISTLTGFQISQGLFGSGTQFQQMPIWLQGLVVILLSDLLGYWIHRAFHSPLLWPLHSVHHSSKNLDWLSNYRNHPLNDLIQMLLQILPFIFLGLPMVAALWLMQWTTLIDAFGHANLRLEIGPFKKLFVSPAFHRRHHWDNGEPAKNFSPYFPIWDVLFSTADFSPDPQEYAQAAPADTGFFRQFFLVDFWPKKSKENKS